MPSLHDAPTVRGEHAPDSERVSRVAPDAPPPQELAGPARYALGDVLGLGGMGEVRRCHDAHIGRDVARKAVRPEVARDPYARLRFLREARVQGQLEHPCIVPVYDLGVGDDGEAFFTMKRVRGETLEQVLTRLVDGDAEATARWTRRRLLVAFVTVCGAIEYAHERGVLHRDLKPANIMLGRFGEVYVLDWGVARVLDRPDDVRGELAVEPLPQAGRTAAGTAVGTAGYMALEQLAGVDDLDGRADVHALGAILFEMLTLEGLHRGSNVQALVASTITGVEARPTVRAPARDVPVELDEVCVRATAREREGRYESVRALREAVERYLDGDRDQERRRALATELASSAWEAAERVQAGDEGARGEAMRAVGRALALDPDNGGALHTFVRLLVSPPRRVPAEVEAEVRAADDAQRVDYYRGGVAGYGIWLALTPLALWVGVRDHGAFAAMVALVAACVAVCAVVARTKRWVLEARGLLMALSVAAITVSGRVVGPFALVPALSVVVTFVFALTPDTAWRGRFLAMGVAGLLAPTAVELSGVVAPSYVLREGVVELHPRMVNLPAAPLFAALVAVHLGVVLAATRVAARMRDGIDAAARQIHVQAWQLRQIVPAEQRDAVKAPRATG